ncbi:MAG: ATP-binding protein [Vampirovibrio sp.]|nr:ATP-binding protein [Vampirovibrio sp.]
MDENLIHTGLVDEEGDELILLPSVAIYGANASGKSSLLEALSPMGFKDASKLVTGKSFFFNPFETSSTISQLYQEPFENEYHAQSFKRFSENDHLNQPPPTGSFTARLSLLGTRPLKDKIVYNNKNSIVLDGFDNSMTFYLENLSDSKNARFYYCLDEILEQSKAQIEKKLGIFNIEDENNFPLITTLKNGSKRKKLENLLKKADFNIKSLRLKPLEIGGEMYALEFTIKDQEGILRYNDQSEGTKKFLLIMPTIVHVLETGAVLLADELEAHLHPDLCRAIIELFNNPETNPKGSQLIFTTHNQDFMAPNLMRPDQIYFVNKDQATGASEVYRASSDKSIDWTRADARLAYHLDRLGGKPHIEDLSLENEISED